MIVIDPVRLPEDVERGAQVGPQFQTSLIPLSSGREQANRDWIEHRIIADISYGIQKAYPESDEDLEEGFRRIVDFFMLRNGRFRGFLFKNPLDSVGKKEKCYPHPTSNTLFQLSKTIADEANSYKWKITHPDVTKFTLYHKQGNAYQELPTQGGNGFPAWQHEANGIIKFASPIGDNVYADFEYFVPMRFDTDLMRVQLTRVELGAIPEITIQQVTV